MNIAIKGIDLDKGKAGADFSDGRGFYMTNNFQFALDWSKKFMKRKNTSVVVFELENPENIFSKYKGKCFDTADDTWVECVQYFRNKKPWAMENEILKGLSRADFIFGPTSKDGSSAGTDNWTPAARVPPKYQLCVKNLILSDELFVKCSIRIIFLN